MPHDNNDKFYNPLKRFQSYAYHHILIACDSTTTANLIEKRGTITELQRPRANRTSATKYLAQPAIPGTKDKNFVVLIDGLVDSDFYITGAQWTTHIAPTQTGQHTMMQVEGKLEIFEPLGVDFMRQLVNLGSELGTDVTGIVFMLKTIFVGNRDDDPPPYNVEMLPSSKPFLFTLYNLTSVISETGASYELSIVGASNGFAKLPHVSNIAKGFSMEINTSDSVTETLRKAFVIINDQYLSIANELAGVDVDFATGRFAAGSRFRQVIYSIESSDYDTDEYKAGTNEQVITETVPGKQTLSFGEGASLDEIVDQIMKSSREVKQDAAKNNYLYKITSMLNSSPDEICIDYQVNRYKQNTTPFSAIVDKIPSDIPESEIRTYDYIFTGKNTDILEFDIKMNMGMSFFHTASSSTHPLTQDSVRIGETQCQTKGSNDGASANPDGKPRGKTPLYLGDKITDPEVRNSSDPLSSAAFQSLLERHAFLESTAISMKITGDPTLMSQMLETEEVQLTPENAGQTRKRTYLSTPIMFKINIQYPIDGTLQPFWYKGLYTLQRIENTFNNGEFTQKLILYSLPIFTKEADDKCKAEKDSSSANVIIGDSGEARDQSNKGTSESQRAGDKVN